MDEQDELACWLCRKSTPLTREHTPPKSAYNSEPVILQRLSEEALERGYIAWEDGAKYEDGHYRKSLCDRCNRLGGRVFVPSYSEFVRQIAAKVSSRIPLRSVEIDSIRNPQLVFRQILMQFVSSNGASFVAANPWIQQFLLTRKVCQLPKDVNLYIFATQTRGMRTTGIGGQILLDKLTYRVMSEFTYWPLGTVLSFTELNDEPLACITHWSELPYKSKKKVRLRLPVNPARSPSPLDFRDDLDILVDMGKPSGARPDGQVAVRIISEMEKEIALRSGRRGDKCILTGRPTRP
jgi:hypothetical protein